MWVWSPWMVFVTGEIPIPRCTGRSESTKERVKHDLSSHTNKHSRERFTTIEKETLKLWTWVREACSAPGSEHRPEAWLAWMNSHHRYRFSYRCTPVGTSSWDWDEKGQARFSSFLPIAPVVIIIGLGQGMKEFWSCVWSKTYETTLHVYCLLLLIETRTRPSAPSKGGRGKREVGLTVEDLKNKNATKQKALSFLFLQKGRKRIAAYLIECLDEDLRPISLPNKNHWTNLKLSALTWPSTNFMDMFPL